MQRLPSPQPAAPQLAPRKQLIDNAIANGNNDALATMNLTNSERAYVSRQRSMQGAGEHIVNLTNQASAPAEAAYKKQSGGAPLTPTSIKASDQKQLMAATKKEALGIPYSPAAVIPKLADQIAGIGPGLVSTAISAYHHPVGTAEKVAKATRASFKETATHPLRQVGQDPLGIISNLSVALAAPGSIAGRASAVADAARATDVGALAKAARIGKAAVQQPRPVDRSIVTARNAEGAATHAVHPLASINHSMGLLQKHVIDPVTQWALEHPQSPAAKVLNNRLVGPQVKVGREIRAAERVTKAAGEAPAAAISRAGKKLSAAEAKAVLIKASGRPAEEWQQLEQNAIRQGIGVPKAQQAQLALTKAAMKHLDSPRVNAAAEVIGKAMNANGDLRGLSEEEQLQRLGAHSLAIQHGAHGFEGLNPAQELHDLQSSLEPSPTLKAATAERDRIANQHQAALEHEQNFLAKQKAAVGRLTEIKPGLTEEAATARLGGLDKQYHDLVRKLVPETSRYGGTLSKAEQLRRNFENSRAGRGNRIGSKPLPTVSSEEFRLAENALQHLVERHAGHPLVDQAAQLMRERDDLRSLLNRRAEATFASEKPPALPGPHPAVTGGPSLPLDNPVREKINNLGHALEVAQQHVDRLTPDEAATHARIAELRQQLTDEGRKVREAGGFYTPMLRESKPLRQRVSSIVGGRGSKYGQSAVMPREQRNYPYEGGMLARGDYKTDVARITGQTFRNTQSIAQARRIHQTLYDMGKPTKEAAGGEKFADPVRPTQAVSESLKRMANTETPLKTRGEDRTLTAAVKAWYDETQAKPGEEIRYVDKRLLAPLRPYEPLMGKVGEGIDRGNQLVRVGRYLLPRYLQWLPQNFAFTAPRQGVWMLRNAVKWKTEFPNLAPDVRDRIYSVMGNGPAHALEGDSKFLGKTQEHLAGFWNRVNDMAPRAMAWIHEAESAGFHNAAGYTRLATDPKLEQTFIQVTRRANKESGDYALSNVEKATLKKLVPSWAWDKAASQYVGRLLIEHPYLSRFLATEGSQGQQQVDAFFKHLHGLMPSWMAGVLPLSPTEGFNTSGISPTDTPAQLLQIASGREAAAHTLAPLPAGAVELATGRSVSGGPQSRTQTLLKTAEKFGPAREIATAVGKPGLFAAGPKAAVEDLLGSPVEKVDMKQAAKSGLTTLGTRAQKDAFARQKALEQTGSMIRATNAPPEWRKAYMVGTQAEVDRNQAKSDAQRALPKGQKLSEAQKYKITMQTLLQHKMMSSGQYQKAVSAIPRMTGHQLNYWERKAWDELGPGSILSKLRSYHHKLQESKQKPVGAAAANG